MDASQMKMFIQKYPKVKYHMVQKFIQAVKDGTYIPGNGLDTTKKLFEEFDHFLLTQNNCE